jgi:hypothetical protein
MPDNNEESRAVADSTPPDAPAPKPEPVAGTGWEDGSDILGWNRDTHSSRLSRMEKK